jgi:cytochrome P450
MSVDLAPLPATARAQWLPPSQWPAGDDHLFTVAPFRADVSLPVISRYADVRAALINADGAFSRVVPFEVIPAAQRHRTLYASWGLDDADHRHARGSLASINRGSTAATRQFTRDLTCRLMREVLREDPPWDLTRVIYAVSMQVVLEHTLQAPVLLPYARRLRELTRDHVAAAGGFFGIRRDEEAEGILLRIVEGYDELPPGSLARHLVDLHRRRPEQFTVDHLAGQLWLLVVSSETQATETASLVGMLLETDQYHYARSAVHDPVALELLVAEAGRRGIVFPASMVVARRPVTFDGQTLDPGRPCLVSYAAANLDPAVFDDPLRFDPRRREAGKHLAFGLGDHRCQGEVGAEQFVADVTTALLEVLPADVRLDGGMLLRETGISMSVARLPVAV